MRLRSLAMFGAGIATGLAIARKMTQDDPTSSTGRRAASTHESRRPGRGRPGAASSPIVRPS